MATLGGLFASKPRCKRNFLLENIRDVCKEKQKKNPSENYEKNKSVQHVYKHSQSPKSSRSQHKKSVNSTCTQSHPISRHKSSCITTSLKQNTKALNPKTDIPLRTPSVPHSLSRQIGSDGKDSSKALSPSFKYIDHENVPFRWTQVCSSAKSYTLCHQSVQTLNEHDLESLLEDAPVRYPSIDKQSQNFKGKPFQSIEWPAHADEEESFEFENAGSNKSVNSLSISPVELSDNNTGQLTTFKSSEKQSILSHSGKQSPTLQFQNQSTCSAKRPSFKDSFSNIAEDPVNRNHKLEDFEHQNSRHTLPDMRQVEDQLLKSDLRSKISLQKTESLESTSTKNSGPPSRAPSNYQKGVIPKYLAKRITEQKALLNPPEVKTAETLEEKRRSALKKAREDYEALISELNKMPVRTDTLRTKMRKIEIEKELNDLEKCMSALNRISDPSVGTKT